MSDSRKPSPGQFDAEFDAFLREERSRLAELYRKLPHPEPDAALDARVRARAGEALREHAQTAATQTRTPHARVHRWLPALGAAATLVLVAGLAWRLVPTMTTTREATPAAQILPPAAPAQSENTAAAPAPAAKPALEPLPPTPPEAASRAPQALPRTEAEGTPLPAAAPKIEAESVNDAAAALAKAAAPEIAAPAPPAFSPAEQEHKRNAPVPPPPALAAPDSPAPAARRRETAKIALTPAATANPAVAESVDAAQARAGAAAAGPAAMIEPEHSGSARYRWKVVGGSAAGTSPRSGIYPPDPPPLQAWITIIRRMLRDGHRDAARMALADLRSRHPDFRVPADLRDLE